MDIIYRFTLILNKIGECMNVDKFIEQLTLATNVPTVYATGGWGASANYPANKTKYADRTPFNREDIMNAPSSAFFFDCVCLVKGILWGWDAESKELNGGAIYASNDVPDYSIANIKRNLTTNTTNFSDIERGEFLYLNDEHCGIYIGNGLAIESTPAWADGVQITAVANIETGTRGYPKRRWDGHGKLPWVEYNEKPTGKVIEEDGWWGKNTTYWLQKMLGTVTDGIISSQPMVNKQYCVNASTTSWEFTRSYAYGSDCIEALQHLIGAEEDRFCGKETITKLQELLDSYDYYSMGIDGYMGYYTVLGLQKLINAYFQNLL